MIYMTNEACLKPDTRVLTVDGWVELYNVDRKTTTEKVVTAKPNTPHYTYPTIDKPIDLWG